MIAALVRQRATWAACSAAPRVGSQRFLHSALASLSKFTCAATPETPFDSSAFRTSVVDSLASLESAKRAVLASTRVALDTEFVRGINYSPSLELVQLATTDHTIHVVDCRVLEELQRGAVTDLLNAVISKPVVLHAADADLQLVYHWTQQLPANGIFDTQVASKLAGIGPLDSGQIGYAALVKQLCKQNLDKSQTLTDWRLRPLTAEQIEYAAEDVKHLFHLQDSLVQRLGTLNRLGWLPDYASSLLDASRFKPADPLLAWRRVFRRSRVQGIEAECVFRELAAWRERVSVKTNAMPSFVARDDMLVAMSMFATQHALANAASQSPAPSASVDVSDQPRDATPPSAQTAATKVHTIRLKEPMQLLSGLKRIQGIKPVVVDKHAASLIAAVQRGLEVCAAFRASPAGVAFPGPFDSASHSSAGEDAAAIYQPALHRYFESTLPGALKPVVVPATVATTPVPSSHAIVGLPGIQRLWTETISQKLSIPVALLCVDEQPDATDPSHAAPSSAAADDAIGSSYRSKSWQRNVIGDDLAKIKSGSAALKWNPSTSSLELVDLIAPKPL